jgi:hypothetical protein
MRQTQRSRSQGHLPVVDPDEEQVAAQIGGEAFKFQLPVSFELMTERPSLR